MKRMIIVHRWEGTPQSDWYPWIIPLLEKEGWEVIIPEMPNTEEPKIQEWVDVLVKIIDSPDANTYFIGHSIGCQAILRYLETIHTPVSGAIFVAGWFNLENLESIEIEEIARPWIYTPIDVEKIKIVLPESTLIISDNDPYDCFEENKKRFSEFITREVVIPKGDHFTDETFPELIKYMPSI